MLVGWVDTENDGVADDWPDSVYLDEPQIKRLLATAHETCEAYAPSLADGAEVPQRYKTAQVLQARAIWQMQRQGPGDQFAEGGYSVSVYPLDARIRQMLRPKSPFGGLR